MKRRAFITLLGGAAVLAPRAARAQTTPRIAVLMATRDSDPDGRARLEGFLQGFQKLGWLDGRNIRIEVRWADGSPEQLRSVALEIVATTPNLIVANGSAAVAELKRATPSIPIVFALVNEPVTQGFIASVARPGGNITGFTLVDFSLVGKSMQILKTMAPGVARIGLMFNPESYPFYDTYLRKLQADASQLVEVTRAGVVSVSEIDEVIANIAARPGGGLLVLPDAFNAANQATIQAAVQRHRLPHIVPWRQFVSRGGLMSYGPDTVDIFRRAAEYADRILKGDNPAELPAQAPTKYELAINLRTVRALGLEAPPALLATADEVIE